MMTPERDKLTQRFERMRAEGLVDVKFLLVSTPEGTAETVCGEVNAVLDELECGNGVEFAFNDMKAGSISAT